MKKILILLFTLILCITLVACDGGKDPCTEHVDENEDLVCDVCGEEVEKKEDEPPVEDELKLIDGGEARFQIVVGTQLDPFVVRAIDTFITNMSKLGITVERVDDAESTVQNCEVLVGDVQSRGDKYDYDQYSLGKKGYVITRVDNKIIVEGGSAETALEAFDIFVTEIIGYKKGASAEELASVVYTNNSEVLEVQDNYRITGITVDGVDMKGYTIAVDKTNKLYYRAAIELQDHLYTRAGYYFEIVSLADADKSIIFEHGDAGMRGFKVHVDDGCVRIACAFDDRFDEAFEGIISKISVINDAKLEFSSSRDYYTYDVAHYYYKDFPAIKGDGSTNDFEAIKAVHELANAGGQTVVAQNGKTYYIGKTDGKTIKIMTDVQFGTAKFVIDDSDIELNDAANRSANIFTIASSYSHVKITQSKDPDGILAAILAAGGIKTTDTHINLGINYPALVVIEDSTKNMYNRWGHHAGDAGPDDNRDGIVDEGHANAGKLVGGNSKHEFIIVDKDGNIDASAAMLFDYDNITSLYIVRIDDKPITVSGGTFTTRANRADCGTNWIGYDRGFAVERSNVTLTDIKHYVTDEPDKLSPYGGFIAPSYTNNLLVKDSVLTGHKNYNNHGSYDICGYMTNNMTFKNVTQTNFFDDNGIVIPESKLWGIMGTNYCKNITYDGCLLSRLDAHAGVVNATVINSTVRQINLIGGGTARVENSTIYNNTVIALRSDYGSTWRGDVIIKDVDMIVGEKTSAQVVHGGWQNWEFGYDSVMPVNISIDGLTVDKEVSMYVLWYNVGEGVLDEVNNLGTVIPNVNKVTVTQSITVKNTPFEFTAVSTDPYLIANLTINYED